jgi:hypothetical protein
LSVAKLGKKTVAVHGKSQIENERQDLLRRLEAERLLSVSASRTPRHCNPLRAETDFARFASLP